MPQPTNLSNKNKKKVATSNGRIPAFNNTFAFRHNPKSKKTASILASPIQNCCRRCHEKIVWRKTYRKYKPLTQPTICNLCNKRNITAAYHTVCNTCSVSHPKAMALLQEWNNSKKSSLTNKKDNKNTTASNDLADRELSSAVSVDSCNDQVEALTLSFEHNLSSAADEGVPPSQLIQRLQSNDDTADDDVTEKDATLKTASTRRNHQVHKRVCTVCFKQPALPVDAAADEECDDDNNNNNRPLKLRQVKALQRQREKQQYQQDEQGRKKKAPITDVTVEDDAEGDEHENDDEDEVDEDKDEQHDDDDADVRDTQYSYGARCDTDRNDELNRVRSTTATGGILDIDDDGDINDPFLQAIGGAQNLLVGEAYQKRLLEQNANRFP